MLNIIFATRRDQGYFIAERLHREGNLVKLYNVDQFDPQVKGPVKRIYSVDETLPSTDLVIAWTPYDTVELVARAKGRGIPVYGGGKKAEVIGLDEQVHSLINKVFWQKEAEGVPVLVELQRLDNGWAEYATISSVSTKIMPGNIGPMLAVPTVGWTIEGSKSELVKQVKELFDETFKGIIGPVSLPILVQPNELSLSAPFQRGSEILFGCNLTNNMFYSEVVRRKDFVEFFFRIAVGKDIIVQDNKVVACVSLWNIGQKDTRIDEGALKHLWFVNQGTWSVSAAGDTVREAGRRVMRTVRNVVATDNVAYRTDVLFDTIFILDKITGWGWIDATKVRDFKRSVFTERVGAGGEVQEKREDRESVSGKSSQGTQTGISHSLQ